MDIPPATKSKCKYVCARVHTEATLYGAHIPTSFLHFRLFYNICFYLASLIWNIYLVPRAELARIYPARCSTVLFCFCAWFWGSGDCCCCLFSLLVCLFLAWFNHRFCCDPPIQRTPNHKAMAFPKEKNQKPLYFALCTCQKKTLNNKEKTTEHLAKDPDLLAKREQTKNIYRKPTKSKSSPSHQTNKQHHENTGENNKHLENQIKPTKTSTRCHVQTNL